MERVSMRRLITYLFATTLLTTSAETFAAAFQLWEQDGASVGNYHAGYAALANDASTAFYNPAGIPRIQNQQLVVGAVIIPSSFKYKGSVTVIEHTPQPYNGIVAQGGTFNVVPNIHYVAPITERIGFGFSIVVPFGLKTNYGRSTPLRYAATLTSISVIDYSPSLGFQINDQASVGLGLDIQKLNADFNSVGTLIAIGPITDTDSTNTASGTGYGFHLGGLYQFTPTTRVGLSYHSQVVYHLSGTSTFRGPIAEILNNGKTLYNGHAKTKATLPPYTALSAYHLVNPQWAIMGSAIYTQWSTFRRLVLNNIAGAVSPAPGVILPSTTIQVIIPEYYRNAWNLSVGADFYANDKFTVRGGVGYDQSPVNGKYRNVQLPDGDRYVIALGGHYQATNALGFDLGWTHLFFGETSVNPPPQTMGGQTVTTSGKVNGGADVFGAQVTWNM